jgi:lipopolysaccharide export system ATP-binding protein
MNKYHEIINDLHISEIQDRKGSLLSGGERRRVEVGRLLGTSPEVVLLDEPFAGVDPVAISEIRDIILKLKK